jgi:rRNA-processing protein FCF1
MIARAVGAAAGTALGAAAGVLIVLALRESHPGRAAVLAALGSAALALAGMAVVAAALSWLDFRLAGRMPGARELPPAGGLPNPAGAPCADNGGATAKILDTNVIIDGRIADVCETGFIEGALIVPQFVLRELQGIADSADPVRRNRGRRGLDVLAKMQKRPGTTILVSDRDFPLVREVDAKLVALARETGARIVTNDNNLNKVAGVNGVTVLNVNQLAGALRPAAVPGEAMRVTVLKEGKETNQGVAYLDDGTMVVVDNARRLIGRELEVTVTSSIQTSAGRMIFAQPAARETGSTVGAGPS